MLLLLTFDVDPCTTTGFQGCLYAFVVINFIGIRLAQLLFRNLKYSPWHTMPDIAGCSNHRVCRLSADFDNLRIRNLDGSDDVANDPVGMTLQEPPKGAELDSFLLQRPVREQFMYLLALSSGHVCHCWLQPCVLK